MGNGALVVVHPPNYEGARQVTIGMQRKLVRSREELVHFLRRNDFDGDIEDTSLVEWRGGGSRVWGRPGTGPSDKGSWKKWSTFTLMVGGFLGAAIFFGNSAKKDIMGALTYTGRLAGASLLVMAFIALVAAVTICVDYSLRHRLKYSGAVVLFGVIAVLGSNLLLLGAQVGVGEYTHWVFLWIAFIVWSSWVLWELIYRQRAWGEVPHRRRFATALSVSAAIAAANFTYTQIYQPYALPVTVTATASFGTARMDPKGQILHLPLTLRYKNTGKVSASVVAFNYEVIGVTWTRNPDGQDVEKLRGYLESGDSDLDIYTGVKTPYEITKGMLVEPGRETILDPGDEVTEERVVEIPAKSGYFDAVEAYAEGIVMKQDRAIMAGEPENWKSFSWKKERGRSNAPRWVTDQAGVPADSDYVEYRARLRYSNEILNLIRKPRYMTMWWVIGKKDQYGTGSGLIETVAIDGEEGNKPTNAEFLRNYEKYGLAYTSSGYAEVSYFEMLNTRSS
ncbi:hypothetical protein [Streptomyces sp. NPDC046197]|uniref:hypothetical protein n=1 Tax=Streptomyces sp. NPDC046197 TaxID=3154337 RepID=UPI0033E1EDA7